LSTRGSRRISNPATGGQEITGDDTVTFGERLRREVARGLVPFIGVYDVFSASLAARHYDALFVSGFSFAASHYGLPDVGFIAWPDIVAFVQRLRTVLPEHHLLVDVDDGYCDTEVACHVAAQLERIGASGIVLEDQERPRRCGHVDGKRILALDEYLAKLERMLAARRDLFVVARTDASDPDDILRRVRAFTESGADAILVDGVRDLAFLATLRQTTDLPLAFNQIAGGKSPPASCSELAGLGASLVIYSTPCLFAAQAAIDDALTALVRDDGRLPADGRIGIRECNAVLDENLRRSSGAPVEPSTAESTRTAAATRR
jgi:2-methylisocitrate lyase-like PEP mutase family enzyme